MHACRQFIGPVSLVLSAFCVAGAAPADAQLTDPGAGAALEGPSTFADAAMRLSGVATKYVKTSVAVVDFVGIDGRATPLGRYVAEELSVALARQSRQVRVVDRSRLDKVLEEHKLSVSGLVDPQTASRLGRLVGADALVTGSITPLGDSLRIAVKLVDTDTAQLLTGLTLDLPRTKALDDLNGRAPSADTKGAERDGDTHAPASILHVEQDGLRFQFAECANKGGRLDCRLTLVNESGERMPVTLYWQYGFRDDLRTYLVDAEGTQYLASEVALGSLRAWGLEHFVAQDVEPWLPMSARFVFDRAPRSTRGATLVAVYQTPRGLEKATFKLP